MSTSWGSLVGAQYRPSHDAPAYPGVFVREAGLSIELFDDPRAFVDAELDLEGRARIAAAGTPALSRAVGDALTS